MAGKTDTDWKLDLRTMLEEICLEYQAQKYILIHYGPNNWATLLNEYYSQRANKSRVSQLFDEASVDLQNMKSDPLIDALLEARVQVQVPLGTSSLRKP